MNESEKRNQRAVQAHLVRAVLAAHEEGSAPAELLDLVHGSTIEEVDTSLARIKATAAQIVQRARQEAVRPSDVDPVNVREGFGDQQIPDVSQMSMQDYAKFRAARGIGQSKGVGILGPIGH